MYFYLQMTKNTSLHFLDLSGLLCIQGLSCGDNTALTPGWGSPDRFLCRSIYLGTPLHQNAECSWPLCRGPPESPSDGRLTFDFVDFLLLYFKPQIRPKSNPNTLTSGRGRCENIVSGDVACGLLSVSARAGSVKGWLEAESETDQKQAALTRYCE